MIVLNEESQFPLYTQIYQQIKEQITDGELDEGSRLLSARLLAKTLNISRNTVDAAYLQLCSEGYIKSKPCSGFVVEKFDNAMFAELKTKKINRRENDMPVRAVDADDRTLNFQYGKLSIEDFPVRLWSKFSNQNMHDAAGLAAYGDRKGELELRVEVMKYLNKSRGVHCRAEQVIICSGTQPCLSLLCQLFRKDHSAIAIEDPGYDGARCVFINHGYNVQPIGVTPDGLDIRQLDESMAKLVYITPSHQFPMGFVTPIQKRVELLEWASRRDGFIIEDDYDSELRYSGRPIPSLQCIDTAGHVIYIGTFSKAFSPALRVSYMVLPEILLNRYEDIFGKYNSPVPWLQQKNLANFMISGQWESHIRKMCLSCKKRHDLLLSLIHSEFGEKVTIHGRNAGLHVILEVHTNMQENELISRAQGSGVRVYPVSQYWMRPNIYSDNMILLGFSSLSESDITDGIHRLSQVWFDAGQV